MMKKSLGRHLSIPTKEDLSSAIGDRNRDSIPSLVPARDEFQGIPSVRDQVEACQSPMESRAVVQERRDSVESTDSGADGRGSKRLTLSAFHRPEQTVRLTRADSARKFEEFYDFHADGCRVLGHGAFSTVRLAIRKLDGVQVAVKSIAKHEALRARRSRKRGRRYLEEWDILRRMTNHPNIISLLDMFETDEEVQLVLEYCPGGELFDDIQRRRHTLLSTKRGHYAEPQAARITQQILSALADLHDHGIVHRDVKPENILIMDGSEDGKMNVKLCDFGVARSIVDPATLVVGQRSPPTPGRSRAYSMIGSSFYAAPEINVGSSYDTAVDVYSLGVTLYILLCGLPPVFSGSDDSEVVFPHAHWKEVSDEAKDLLLSMLHRDVNVRVSAREASHHVWIRRFSAPSSSRGTSTSVQNEVQKQGVNLHAVRRRLNATDSNVHHERNTYGKRSSLLKRKRARMERRTSSCLLALADLYRDVTSPPRTRDRSASGKKMRVSATAISF